MNGLELHTNLMDYNQLKVNVLNQPRNNRILTTAAQNMLDLWRWHIDLSGRINLVPLKIVLDATIYQNIAIRHGRLCGEQMQDLPGIKGQEIDPEWVVHKSSRIWPPEQDP